MVNRVAHACATGPYTSRSYLMATLRRVALLIETSRQFGRDFLRGVMRYQRECGPWSMYFEPHGLGEPPPKWLSRWDGDGILARIVDKRLARAVLRAKLPTVDLRGALPHLGVPHVAFDNGHLVALAFEHLRERGFRQFAYCGVPAGQNEWIEERGWLFERRVMDAGFPCAMFQGKLGQLTNAKMCDERPRIAQWIRKLPKPIGILACNDDRGQQVLDACLQAGVRVPDEVAVVGADNDEFLCNLSTPRLTSIETNTQEVGYQAAALLDRLMDERDARAGKPTRTPKAPVERILIRAARLIPRDSTDVMAVDDAELVAGLRFIREHACRPISVTDLVRAIHVSRRVIERRFQQHLGRSPNDEILRVRLERAKLLLSESELSTAQIAHRTGFATASYFCHLFRSKTGRSPAAWRVEALGGRTSR